MPVGDEGGKVTVPDVTGMGGYWCRIGFFASTVLQVASAPWAIRRNGRAPSVYPLFQQAREKLRIYVVEHEPFDAMPLLPKLTDCYRPGT